MTAKQRGLIGSRLSGTNRYGLVLGLIGLTYLVTVADTGDAGSAVVIAVQLATVWVALTVSESVHARRIAGAGVVLVVAGTVVGGVLGYRAGGSNPATGALYVVNAMLYLLAPILILLHLMRRRTIDLQTFLGAIAAYLLIGMMFAFSYRALGEFQSTPFFGAQGDGSAADDLFFSFVTLTTTGYGNLVPAANPGQTLAVLEAVTGQLFLVTAVAKIVTGWNPLSADRERPPSSPPSAQGER